MKNQKEYSRQYYLNNKENWKRDTPEKQQRHRQLVKESAKRHRVRRRENEHKWIAENYSRYLWSQTKRRAKYNNIHWDLSETDIIIPDICPYLNIPLTRTLGNGVVWTNASVDRIDNDKGYTKDNIMIISRLANSMKQHSTKEQLITFAENVLKIHKNLDDKK